MKGREELVAAVRRVAWGFVLLHFHFNLGSLDILPDWGGICLILKAIPVLTRHSESTGLLRPFGVGLAAWEGMEWCCTLVGANLDLGVLSIVTTIVSLYFRFQLLTELVRIAQRYGCPQDSRLLVLRNVDAVIITVLALPIPWEELEPFMLLIIVVAVVAAALICGALFSLARGLDNVGLGPDPQGEFH